MEKLVLLAIIIVAIFVNFGSCTIDHGQWHSNFKVLAPEAVKSNFTIIEYGETDDHKIEQRAVSSSTIIIIACFSIIIIIFDIIVFPCRFLSSKFVAM